MTKPLPPGTPRGLEGRPPIEASDEDLEKIKTMAGLGLTQRMMATILGWSEDTFLARKKDDPRVLRALEGGQATAQANVATALYNKAIAGETSAIRWYEITRCGRSDRVRTVDETEDHPGMADILSMSTEQTISELEALVGKYRPNGKHGRNGKPRRRV